MDLELLPENVDRVDTPYQYEHDDALEYELDCLADQTREMIRAVLSGEAEHCRVAFEGSLIDLDVGDLQQALKIDDNYELRGKLIAACLDWEVRAHAYIETRVLIDRLCIETAKLIVESEL